MNAPAQLRMLLVAGAIYDLAALLLLLAMPQWLFDFFGHPPVDAFLFRMAALPLWMGAAVYLLAARRLTRGLVDASLILRGWGALGIGGIVVWHAPDGAMAYWSFVIADLLWFALLAFRRKAARGDHADASHR